METAGNGLVLQKTVHIAMLTVKAAHNAVPSEYGSSKVKFDLYVIIKAVPNVCSCSKVKSNPYVIVKAVHNKYGSSKVKFDLNVIVKTLLSCSLSHLPLAGSGQGQRQAQRRDRGHCNVYNYCLNLFISTLSR